MTVVSCRANIKTESRNIATNQKAGDRMKLNMDKLRGKIVEARTTQEAVADSIGIDRSTFYRKIKCGGSGFTIGEIHKIVEAIPLTKQEAIEIFLTE